jgi:putative peptide zinc metalloprotease protein
VVLPPPPTPPTRHERLEGAPLPSWSGTPLDARLSRPYLQEGVLFCQIGDPRRLEAILVIDQGDIEFVQPGQKVDLKLDALPYDTYRGEIQRISLENLKITPQRLSTKAGGELPSQVDPETGVETPQSASFQALVPLEDHEDVMLIGLRGRAKIHTRPLSLGERLWRMIMHTFNFRL